MKKSRFLALLLCVIFVLPMAMAHAGQPGKIELKYWAHQNEGWNKSHQDIVDRFNASQDRIVVKTEFFPYDDFEAKTQTSMIAKDGSADIYEIWGGWAADFAPTGALAEVPEDIARELEADYMPPTYGTFTHEGKYYGMPLEFNIESGGLLVNKKQFEERGLAYPKTWDEMIKIAEETSETDGVLMNMKGFDFVTWDNVMYTWLSMILSQGANYLKEDGTFNLTSPEAVSAMEELVGYITVKHLANIDPLTGGGDNEGHYNLAEDRGMMVARGPWVLSECQEIYGLEVGREIDYIAMPWYGDKVAFAAETGWGLAVSSSSKNQEAAWEFIRFMQQEENIIGHLIVCGMLPARKSLFDNQRYLEAMTHVTFMIDILPNGQYLGHFNTDVFKENINNMFIELCTAGENPDVKGALMSLEERLNSEFFAK